MTRPELELRPAGSIGLSGAQLLDGQASPRPEPGSGRSRSWDLGAYGSAAQQKTELHDTVQQ